MDTEELLKAVNIELDKLKAAIDKAKCKEGTCSHTNKDKAVSADWLG